MTGLCAAVVSFLVLAGSCARPAGEPPLERIAFGSCADQEKPQPIWESVLATRPDLFVFLGDNVYADTRNMDEMRTAYAKLGAQPGFRRLRRRVPLLATWDDHDYGENDAGADYPKRAESQQIFLDFFEEPADSPRRERAGVYDAKVFGPPGQRVQIILLDTRYFRSPLVECDSEVQECGWGPYAPNPDPEATILGPAQWRWLEEQLRVPAELRIIVSSIQVIAEDHGWETWANFPHERRRLFDLIRETGAAGVLFISGDRHLAELSMMEAAAGYPLYDLTASALNRSSQKWRAYEVNRHRVGTMNWGDNFGLIIIDWNAPDPLLRLQIRDVEGEVTLQRKLPLSLLQAKAEPE